MMEERASAKTDWWELIVADPPFNVHVVHRLEDASFVVGESAKNYVAQFMLMYARALGNSLITTVAGDPGTGKSYVFAHLKYRMLVARDPPGIPIVYRLMGRDYRPADFLREIRGSQGYQGALRQLGLEDEPIDDERLVHTFAAELAEIRKQLPRTVLCLFVDNVDEYVRLMGTARKLKGGDDDAKARQEAFLSLLRVLNSINDMAGSGICSVLSLTRDLVNDFHLSDPAEQDNLVTGLLGQDSSIRRRFLPIYESPNSTRLHMFGRMTLPEAQEMVAMNLDSWFARHPEVQRELLSESTVGMWNLFPFQTSAIELQARASEYPGEIVLACLAGLHRYRTLRRDLSEVKLGASFEPPHLITESLAASALLQMGQYFQGVASGALSFDELKARVLSDPLFQYLYVLPQEISRLRLLDSDVTRNLGFSFAGFLQRIIRRDLESVSTEPTFVKTRGHMKFPKFPSFDSVVRYRSKIFGVQFLPAAEPARLESRVETGRRALRAEGPGVPELTDHVHCALLVCIGGDDGSHSSKTQVLDWMRSRDSGFISDQGRDYRPRVAIASVRELTAWSWLAIAAGGFFGEPERDLLAVLMEDVDATTWENVEGQLQPVDQRMKWRELFEKAYSLSDEPPRFVDQEKPDWGAWER